MPNKDFKGSCFKCGVRGHTQDKCQQSRRREVPKTVSTNIPTCDHCKKMGHTETNCWYKHGKVQKALVIKK